MYILLACISFAISATLLIFTHFRLKHLLVRQSQQTLPSSRLKLIDQYPEIKPTLQRNLEFSFARAHYPLVALARDLGFITLLAGGYCFAVAYILHQASSLETLSAAAIFIALFVLERHVSNLIMIFIRPRISHFPS